MAWLYARSSTWRRVVQGTQTPLRMLGFTTLVLGGATFLGAQVMGATNPAGPASELERTLRARGSVDARMLADAQRQRLQVLLDESRSGGGGGGAAGEARYRAALE